MEDVQSQPAAIPLNINRVGINNYQIPAKVAGKNMSWQHTVVTADLHVSLASSRRGTHMSRFIETFATDCLEVEYESVCNFLAALQKRLQAADAFVTLRFPFFLQRKSPISKGSSLQSYKCTISGKKIGSAAPEIELKLTVPVMTVCPCSKAISEEGAHSQRADICLVVRVDAGFWFDDLIAIAESAGSAATYPLLKREDEKYVTEQAFAHPLFVEDVVRRVADSLMRCSLVHGFTVEVESHESIHAHNAYARIEMHHTCDSTVK